MSYAVVTTKIDIQTKRQAMETAEDLGLTLSAVIKAFLKQFVHTKSITFSSFSEQPNKYFQSVIAKAEKNLAAGKHSPTFNTGEEAVAWLEK